MSSEDQNGKPGNLDIVWAAVARLQHEHPRHYLILCNAADFDKLNAGIKAMVFDEEDTTQVFRSGVVGGFPTDVTVEVKVHAYAKVGQCYLMRHPDDFLAWGPAHRMVIPMGGAEPGEPWFSASSA
jgi:hypothetical protein